MVNNQEEFILTILGLLRHNQGLRMDQIMVIAYKANCEMQYKGFPASLLNEFSRGTNGLTCPGLVETIRQMISSQLLDRDFESSFFQKTGTPLYKLDIKGAVKFKNLTVDPVLKNILMGWIGKYLNYSSKNLTSDFYPLIKNYEIGDPILLSKTLF